MRRKRKLLSIIIIVVIILFTISMVFSNCRPNFRKAVSLNGIETKSSDRTI